MYILQTVSPWWLGYLLSTFIHQTLATRIGSPGLRTVFFEAALGRLGYRAESRATVPCSSAETESWHSWGPCSWRGFTAHFRLRPKLGACFLRQCLFFDGFFCCCRAFVRFGRVPSRQASGLSHSCTPFQLTIQTWPGEGSARKKLAAGGMLPSVVWRSLYFSESRQYLC